MQKITSGLLVGLVLSSTVMAIVPITANARGSHIPKVAAASNHISLSATEVNGRNVKLVSHTQGSFMDLGDGNWGEADIQKKIRFKFRETGRDEWSVYLVDRSRNVDIQLDLWRKKIVYSDGSNKFDLYTITLASDIAQLTPTRQFPNDLSIPTLTLFAGVKSENQLPYRLDFGGQVSSLDRYILRIPSQKMKLAVSQFMITYPDYYKGNFDPKQIEVRVESKRVPLSEAKWDKEGRTIQIYPEKPVPAGSRVEVVLSNVQNPAWGGTYYFNCQVLSPNDAPVLHYLGTWILSVN